MFTSTTTCSSMKSCAHRPSASPRQISPSASASSSPAVATSASGGVKRKRSVEHANGDERRQLRSVNGADAHTTVSRTAVRHTADSDSCAHASAPTSHHRKRQRHGAPSSSAKRSASASVSSTGNTRPTVSGASALAAGAGAGAAGCVVDRPYVDVDEVWPGRAWSIRALHARRFDERRAQWEYLVEWDGCQSSGQPWPLTWEPAFYVAAPEKRSQFYRTFTDNMQADTRVYTVRRGASSNEMDAPLHAFLREGETLHLPLPLRWCWLSMTHLR
jgi:hypothetical protein